MKFIAFHARITNIMKIKLLYARIMKIMKFIEFHARIMKLITIQLFHSRIMKIMKFIELHARKNQIKKQNIPRQNHENYEIHKNPRQNYENHENVIIQHQN